MDIVSEIKRNVAAALAEGHADLAIGYSPDLRGAGFFATRRLDKVGQQDTDYPGLTRDVGRLFMGVDLQCAQCHKHLTVKDYKQVDFNGLFVAIQNTRLQAAGGEPLAAQELAQEGHVLQHDPFLQVMDKSQKRILRIGLPGGKLASTGSMEPMPLRGEQAPR